MKDRKAKSRTPILAAGGIVLRGDREPRFAVVQLRKLGAWVLPKGKLAADEDVIAAARREVLEETGHRVTIHEFVGTLAYEASGRPKIVQFWRMQALDEPTRSLMRDVTAVRWLALEEAINQLTHPRERAFLEQVGPIALRSAERSVRRAASREQRATDKNIVRRAPPAARMAAISGTKPLAPTDGRAVAPVEPTEHDVGGQAGLVPAADAMAPERPSGQTQSTPETETAAGRNLLEKTMTWFRQVTMPHLPPRD